MNNSYNTTAKSPRLNIIVALAAEARPLIDAYHLKRCHPQMAMYSNADRSIYLLQTGVGAVKCAAGMAYLHAYTEANAATYYLNLGIAGKQEGELGDIFLIDKVTDKARDVSWYPWHIPSLKIPRASLTTVHKPQATYPAASLVDMEGAAFMEAGSLFVTQEHCHLLKVISDNAKTTTAIVNKQNVQSWIQQQWPVIDKVVQHLLQRSADEAEWPVIVNIDAFLQHWHFSQYQQHQLRQYLTRLQINFPDGDALSLVRELQSSKQVLAYFHEYLEQAEYQW